jgi:hypothetical protein
MNVIRQTLRRDQKTFVDLRDPRRRTSSPKPLCSCGRIEIVIIYHRFEFIRVAVATKAGIRSMGDTWVNPGKKENRENQHNNSNNKRELPHKQPYWTLRSSVEKRDSHCQTRRLKSRGFSNFFTTGPDCQRYLFDFYDYLSNSEFFSTGEKNGAKK